MWRMTADDLALTNGAVVHDSGGEVWSHVWFEFCLREDRVPPNWLELDPVEPMEFSFYLKPTPAYSGPGSLCGREFRFDGDASEADDPDGETVYLFAAHNPVSWQRFRFGDLTAEGRISCEIELFFDFSHTTRAAFWWKGTRIIGVEHRQ
ncbi:MAG: hypothetical protein H6718_15030 [Polyangiaceae bacterium]|nr:hypothetical protein [Polyangiaceae bacterium]